MSTKIPKERFKSMAEYRSAKHAMAEKARKRYEAGELDTEYADYIMEHGDPSERVICNGDTLLEAMEDGYLLEEFLRDFYVD